MKAGPWQVDEDGTVCRRFVGTELDDVAAVARDSMWSAFDAPSGRMFASGMAYSMAHAKRLADSALIGAGVELEGE